MIRSSIIVVLIIWYCFGVFRIRAMASDGLPDREQAGPSCAPSGPLPGTFLGPALDIRSESLYELVTDIPDVIGLRALRPDAAAVKVMSVRDSRCIRVVTPDDHVACGYDDILLHDMGEEELPFVSLSELDYLRRIWPRAVFAFMTRYQQNLERKRKECKERFGCTQSGNCTHCGKYIQMDLGKHIAFYHLELVQLWRCPVMCTVWKGTAQDCIDHMRRTHKVPLSVKEANLAKYFPAWTVTRDQWSKMLMPCVSGVAIDTLLFSRIGSPLCHRYRLISRTGSHAAFRGTYLKRLRLFIEESDSAVRRQLHRQLTQDRPARVVKSTDNPASGPLRPPVGHKIVSWARRPRRLKGVASLAEGPELGEHPSAEMSSVQALMELTLPRFAMVEGPRQVHPPWSVTSEPPASPSPSQIEPRGEDSRCLMDQTSFSSVYFNLDALTSSSNEESLDVKKCRDLSVTILCKSEEIDTLVKSEIVLSDDDLPAVSGIRDIRQVVRRRDGPLGGPTRRTARSDSRQEPSAPAVDMLTGTCRPGKVSRTVSTSPLTLDMTVMCTPDAEILQPGAVAQGVLPAYTVNKSVTGFDTSTPLVATPATVVGQPIPQGKDLPTLQLSESSDLLPSFGLSSSPSSSSSPTLPWGTAEDSSPSFSPNRVHEGHSQNVPSE